MHIFEILIFALLSLLIYLLYLVKKDHGYYWQIRKVKYEDPLFLVGNIIDVVLLRKNIGFVLKDLYIKFQSERFFGMWILNVPNLILNCPELIKHILVKDFDYFYDRNVTCNENIDSLSANMLFFMMNPKWKLIRSNTTSMFSTGRMKYIYTQIQAIAKDMVSFIDSRNGKTFNVHDISTKFSTDVICSTAFGIDARSFQDKETPFTKMGKDTFDVTLRNAFAAATYFCKSPLVDIFKIKYVQSSTEKFLSEIFLKVLKDRELNESDRKDLLNVMIEFKKKYHLSDKELVSQAAQFLLAGYETTSLVILFTLFEISSNMHIQQRLREEINDNKDEEGVSYSSLKEMSYLDKIVSESLRKYPIVLFLGRTCMKNYKIPDTDIVLDKGLAVMIPVIALHHDPKYFPNPDKFDPERFSEENVKTRHPFAYLPFGEGQRNCIGKTLGILSVKLALFHIIKNFEVEVDKETKLPLQFSPKTFTLHSNPIYLRFNKLEL